jgi:hypothetical protein
MLVVYSPFILIIPTFDIWTFPICIPSNERDDKTKKNAILISVTHFHTSIAITWETFPEGLQTKSRLIYAELAT